jgi:hypothetical protein
MPVNKNTGDDNRSAISIRVIQFIVPLIVTACGVVAGYVTTIYGIKLDLADKADFSTAVSLDRRLSRIEIILEEKALTREEFRSFGEALDKRLDSIEKQMLNLTERTVWKQKESETR